MLKPKNVRPLEKRDLTALAIVLNETELFPADMLEEMVEPAFTDPENDDIWLAYEHEGVAVAFAFCEPERMTAGTWNLLALAVLPALQGQGIGRLLVSSVEKRLHDQGHRLLLVETSGLPEFELTRQFYKKINYTQEACIRDFYNAGDDKVIFWKSLSAQTTTGQSPQQ